MYIFGLINNLLGIIWKRFKVNCIELELIIFVKFFVLFHDERYILDDGIISLTYFHKDEKLDEGHRIDKNKQNQ